MAQDASQPNPAPEELFEEECHLCGATEDLVPDPNFDFLYLCRNCIGHWQDHIDQIEERDEPPPNV